MRSLLSHSLLALLCIARVDPARAFLFRRDADDEKLISVPIMNRGNQMYSLDIEMGKPAQFLNFTLSNTHAFTAVAGPSCSTCSADSSAKYNPSISTTYRPPPQNASGLYSFHYNGKNISGTLATENCAFLQDDGHWWWYNNQTILVAGSGSDQASFFTGSGMAGLGQSGVPDPKYSIIGQYLSLEEDPLEHFTFSLALYGAAMASATTNAGGDASGGYLHLNGPNPEFYQGAIATMPVVGQDTMANFGAIPTQLGSYDWSLQIQGYVLKSGQNSISGGQGLYGTVEAAYPYILLPQLDANKIYAAIPGSAAYSIPSNAITAQGLSMYQDPLALAWSVPCDTTNVVLYINFKGVSIPIQPVDLWTQIQEGTCVGNIRGWADPTRLTAIFGSTFFRNAYVVFSASADPTRNTIGVANRLLEGRGKDSSNKKVIIGAVVGGVAFLLIVGLLAAFFIRRHRRPRTPPSAIFTSTGQLASRSGTADFTAVERGRSPSSFFGSTKDRQNTQSLVAEPWIPEGTALMGDQVVVTPWTPPAMSEQAFLSPAGTAASLPYHQPPTPSTAANHLPNSAVLPGQTHAYTSATAYAPSSHSGSSPPPNQSMHRPVSTASTTFYSTTASHASPGPVMTVTPIANPATGTSPPPPQGQFAQQQQQQGPSPAGGVSPTASSPTSVRPLPPIPGQTARQGSYGSVQ